jgi:hypothetical protein
MPEGRLEAIQPALAVSEPRMQEELAATVEEFFTARVFPVR